jgi:hypothetical protein
VAKAEDPIKDHNVSSDWSWFTDYAYLNADWTLTAAPDCEVQVGMGPMAFGSPLGERHRFKGSYQFFTLGIGAIHVRVVSGNKPCQVHLEQGKVASFSYSRSN